MTKRTNTQNASLSLYCTQMATALNDAGIDQKAYFERINNLDVPNTMESVKSVFRAVNKKMYDNESTTKLDTKTIQEVYLAVDRGHAQKFGISLPWPSQESLSEAQRNVR